jgi:hypothetical protein
VTDTDINMPMEEAMDAAGSQPVTPSKHQTEKCLEHENKLCDLLFYVQNITHMYTIKISYCQPGISFVQVILPWLLPGNVCYLHFRGRPGRSTPYD